MQRFRGSLKDLAQDRGGGKDAQQIIRGRKAEDDMAGS